MNMEILAQRKSAQAVPPPSPVSFQRDQKPSHFERQLRDKPAKRSEPSSQRSTHEDRHKDSGSLRESEQSRRLKEKTKPRDEDDRYEKAYANSHVIDLTLPAQIAEGPVIATDGEEVLSTLSKLYQDPATLRRDAPILSLLTGHIEELEPQEMPQLVLGNGFVQEAMSAGNLEEFFSTPIDLPKALNELGLSEIADKLSQMSIMDGKKSPAEILNAFGIDSQSALSELKLLQGYLNTDGLNPYMVRAAALRGSVSPTEIPVIQEVQETQQPAQQPAQQQLVQDPIIQTKASQGNSSPDLSIPLGPWESLSVEDTDAANPLTGTASSDSFNVRQDFQKSTQTLNQQGELPDIDLDHMIGDYTEAPQGKTQVAQNNTSTIEALERLNIEQNPEGSALDVPEDDIELGDESFTQNFESQKMDGEQGSEEALASSSRSSSDSSEQGSHPEQGDHEQSDVFQDHLNPSSNRLSNDINESPFDLEIKTQTESVKEANKVRDAVFEKAQILLKDGGGSMKFDLGTKELGQLDLAIDVQNDNLKIKITAESDKAREMLSQELPALRQALAEQNLDLKTVEIGLKHEEQWSEQNPNQGQQQNQQEQQSSETFEHIESLKIGPNINWSQAKQSITKQIRANIPSHSNGNIQIRV